MAASPDPSGPDARAGEMAAPKWLAVPVLVAVAALAGAILPGLLLAAVGLFRSALAGPAMVVGASLTGWAAWPAAHASASRSPAVTPRVAHVAAAAAVVGVALFTAFHLRGSGQWVLTDRDPGAVATAAGWLADEGRLDAPDAPGAFSTVDYASAATAQGWFRDGSRVTPQFMHGTHVALAAARWMGGDDAMLRVTALFSFLAALALFVLASRWLPPWAAAGAAISLAALAPQAFVARGPFTEPLAQALLVGAAALLLGAVDSGARRALVVAGAVAGAVVLARIDGVLGLAALGPWLAARADLARREGRRVGREPLWIGVGVGAASVVALVDMVGPASAYVRLHASEVASQLALAGAVWALSAIWCAAMARWPDRDVDRHQQRRAVAGTVAAAAVVLAVAALWWVRPVLETTRETAASFHVEALQRAEDLPLDPTRRYFEDSARWFAWYLGPTGFALAALGLAGAARILVAGRDRDNRMALAVGLAALPTAVFVWRVRTSPDQLWVMRRFVPATLPLLVTTAWAAAAGAGPAVARWLRRSTMRVVASVVAAAAVAIPVVAAYRPLHDMSLQAGALDAIDETCDALGRDAAVLTLADTSALVLPAAVRFACRVPVAGATRTVGVEELAALSDRWAVDGRRLYVVSDTASVLSGLLGEVPMQEFVARSDRQPEATLTGPPERLRGQEVRWTIALVRGRE